MSIKNILFKIFSTKIDVDRIYLNMFYLNYLLPIFNQTNNELNRINNKLSKIIYLKVYDILFDI